MDCFPELGKETEEKSLLWRVRNNFLLCWKARLPLRTGYWIYFPTRVVKFKRFWQRSPCQLSVYLESRLTTKPGWICVFLSSFKAIGNRELNWHSKWTWEEVRIKLCRQGWEWSLPSLLPTATVAWEFQHIPFWVSPHWGWLCTLTVGQYWYSRVSSGHAGVPGVRAVPQWPPFSVSTVLPGFRPWAAHPHRLEASSESWFSWAWAAYF